ncbi:MAG: hypothetical protein IJ532_02470 [Alphaproteobacteria bacterium]|nr:hypothetical protein [Alphaproteobacteria bacterium]
MKNPFRSGGTKQRRQRCWILRRNTAQYDDGMERCFRLNQFEDILILPIGKKV